MRVGGRAERKFRWRHPFGAALSTQSVDDVASSVMSAGDSDGALLSTGEISTALAANAPDDLKGQGIEDEMASDIVSALDSDSDNGLSTDGSRQRDLPTPRRTHPRPRPWAARRRDRPQRRGRRRRRVSARAACSRAWTPSGWRRLGRGTAAANALGTARVRPAPPPT
ncbi:hypothetical protein ACRAWD_03850 [Caulobacter segnis]